MQVLVTWGAGFLSSHLCDRLLADGHDVLCVGNEFTEIKRKIAHLHGNPGELTMHELAEQILTRPGGTSKLRFLPLPADDPRQRQPDIQLARNELVSLPTIRLEDGLRETIVYFRKTLEF